MIQLNYVANDVKSLKQFLKDKHYSKKSLSAIKQNGALLVNGHSVTVRHMLNPNDNITVHLPQETRSINLMPARIDIEVLYNDEVMIIVNKPPFMNTIPSRLHPHNSLIEAVYNYLLEQQDTSVIHPVSRLDRNTSGIVVFAKHQLFHHLLTGGIDKYYLSICAGKVKTSGNICLPIDRKEDSIIERISSVTGMPSRTEFRRLAYDDKQHLSLLSIKLHTGRTHQIRVHLSAIGHPLLGDTLYGGDDVLLRQALHAHHINFKHPVTHQMIKIEAPLPDDLRPFFNML